MAVGVSSRGEVVCYDQRGQAVFSALRRGRNEPSAFSLRFKICWS
jgi:hypothetical protein